MRVLYPDYLLFNIVFQDWTCSRFSRERSTSRRHCEDADSGLDTPRDHLYKSPSVRRVLSTGTDGSSMRMSALRPVFFITDCSRNMSCSGKV